MSCHIYGKNAVREWLLSGRKVRKLYVAAGAHPNSITDILAVAEKIRIPVARPARSELTDMLGQDQHQSVAAEVPDPAYSRLEDIFTLAEKRGEPLLAAVLDGVEDPRNLGAVIRSAEGAGLHGIIIPRDKAAGLTPLVFKTSAGAAAYLPIVRVTNLVRVLQQLKKQGAWVTGACEKAESSLYSSGLKGPSVLVMGGEGRGLRRLVKESCDFLVSIPLFGTISSLNVSVAAALMFFEARRQREIQ